MENIIHDFSWFAAGAFLALALRWVLNFHEGTRIIYNVLSRYAILTDELAKQIRAAIILKHQTLKKTDLNYWKCFVRPTII